METRWRVRDPALLVKRSGHLVAGTAPRWSWASPQGGTEDEYGRVCATGSRKVIGEKESDRTQTDTGGRGEEPQARE